MTPAEKVAQVLALARSTPYPAERETALEIARRLHNTHRLRDPHLRWELQTALGQEAGPEPPRPAPPAPLPPWPSWPWADAAPDDRGGDPFGGTAQDQDAWDTDWLRDLWEEMARPGRQEQGRRRQGASGPRPKRQKRRIDVQPHDAWRHHWYSIISGYTREVHTHQVTFTCQWCGERVTQQRWPGRPPAYCGADCRREAERVQTRERVRRHRAAKRAAEHTEQER